MDQTSKAEAATALSLSRRDLLAGVAATALCSGHVGPISPQRPVPGWDVALDQALATLEKLKQERKRVDPLPPLPEGAFSWH